MNNFGMFGQGNNACNNQGSGDIFILILIIFIILVICGSCNRRNNC